MTVRLRDNPNPRFDLTEAPFYIGLQGPLKIGTHLLSIHSPGAIRTLTVRPFSLLLAGLQMHATTSGIRHQPSQLNPGM